MSLRVFCLVWLTMTSQLFADEPRLWGRRLDDFTPLLKQKDPEVRADAIYRVATFAEHFPALAVTALNEITPLVTDSESQVRNHALIALSYIGPRSRIAMDAICERLTSDESEIIRGQAAITLGKLDAFDETLSHLKKAAKEDPSEVVRALSILAIAECGNAAIMIPVVEDRLENESDVRVLKACVQSARVYGAAQGADACHSKMMALLTRSDAEFQTIILCNLSYFPNQHAESIAALRKFVSSDNPEIAFAAAQTLVELDKAALAWPFARKVLERKGDFGAFISETLRMITQAGPKARELLPLLRPLLDSDVYSDEAAVGIVAILGKEAVPLFVERLRNPDSSVRYEACLTLEEMGANAANAIPQLLERTMDESRYVANIAASAISKIGIVRDNDEKRAKELLPGMEPEARATLCGAILQRHLNDPTALKYVSRGLESTNDDVRAAAILALSHATPTKRLIRIMVEMLRTRRTNETKLQIGAAERSLSSIGLPAVKFLIDEIESDHTESHARCFGVLAEIGAAANQSVPHVVAAMNAKQRYGANQSFDAEPRRVGLIALSRIVKESDNEAVPLFSAALQSVDPEIRKAAVYGLSKIDSSEATQALIEATLDPNHDIRERAKEAAKKRRGGG